MYTNSMYVYIYSYQKCEAKEEHETLCALKSREKKNTQNKWQKLNSIK